MQFKKILSLCFIILLFGITPVHAVKWDNFGLDSGIYIDTDSISQIGKTMSFTYKFTNDLILNKLSMLKDQQTELSVCYMRATVSCPSGEKLSAKLLCYDKSDNVVIDESNLTYAKNNEPDSSICKNLKKVKRYRKFNFL